MMKVIMIIRTTLYIFLIASIPLYSSTNTNKKTIKIDKKFHKNSNFPHIKGHTGARGCSMRGTGKNKLQGELYDHIYSEYEYVQKKAAIQKAHELRNQRLYDQYRQQYLQKLNQ
jgi:hypothetical protein